VLGLGQTSNFSCAEPNANYIAYFSRLLIDTLMKDDDALILDKFVKAYQEVRNLLLILFSTWGRLYKKVVKVNYIVKYEN
jgi:hypothetical protein